MKDLKSINSFFVIFFIFMPSLSIPIIKIMNNGIVVWILTAVVLLISILINRNHINQKFLIFALMINVLFLVNLMIVPYKHSIWIIYIEFIKFSMIALFLSTQKLDFEKFVKYWYMLSILNIVIWTVFFGEVVNGTMNYMTFGVNMTFSFAISLYSYIKRGKKLDLIIAATCLIVIAIFANRSALLACIGLIIYFIFMRYRRRPVHILLFILSGILIFLLDIKKILIYIVTSINDFLIANNVYSYAFNKFTNQIVYGISQASSGRDTLYEYSVEIIKDGFLPRGVGYFQYLTSEVYPHNFFLDVFIIFGFFGIILLGLFVKYIVDFYKYEQNSIKRDVFSILLVINFIRLFFSSTFIYDTEFWVLAGILLSTIWSNFRKKGNGACDYS